MSSDASHSAPAPHSDGGHAPGAVHHPHVNYVKIWAILCILLVASVIGPFIGEALHMFWVTLVTAFGIAVVKAYLVAKNFMHVNLEKKFIGYLMVTMLVLMALFFGGISPDVMMHEGQRWENTAAKAETARRLASEKPAAH